MEYLSIAPVANQVNAPGVVKLPPVPWGNSFFFFVLVCVFLPLSWSALVFFACLCRVSVCPLLLAPCPLVFFFLFWILLGACSNQFYP